MPRKSPKSPKLLGAIVSKALSGRGLKAPIARQSIIHKWAELVPATVSSHARAVKVVGSTLHLEVDSSAWMHELAAIKHVLLQKVNAGLGPGTAKIKDVRFHQRSWKKEPQSAPAEPAPPTPSERDVRMARKVLEPIDDEKLKATLERILEKDRQLKWRRNP